MVAERQIMKDIKACLEKYEWHKTIIWWERLQSFKIQHYGNWIMGCRKGTPDFVAIVRNKQKQITVIFIEAKGTGGKLRPEQKRFQNRISEFDDVYYLVIYDASVLNSYIHDIGYDTLGDLC